MIQRHSSMRRLSLVLVLAFFATAAALLGIIFQSHENKIWLVLRPRLASNTIQMRSTHQHDHFQRRLLLSEHFDPKTVVRKPPAEKKPTPAVENQQLISKTVVQKPPPVLEKYPNDPLTSNIPGSEPDRQQHQSSSAQQTQDPLQQFVVLQRQPTIYTFWAPVPALSNGDKGTGMTDKTDEQMLKLWKQAWESIGWQAHILTIQDAQQHARFDEFYNQLQSIPLWGKGRKGANREYNQWCYIRWLAMAAVGGGWMSDYDVLPVRKIDFYKMGKFTVHEPGVPSLLSGTQEEWSKMAWAILENGLQHNTPSVDLWSDMKALANLQEQQDQPQYHYAVNKTVMSAHMLLTGKPWTKHTECHRLKRYDAIHFSHNSMKMGALREGEKFRDRPRIAARVMKLFYSYCQS